MKAACQPMNITRWPRLRDLGLTHKRPTTALITTTGTLHKITSNSINHRFLHRPGIWSIRPHTQDRDFRPDLQHQIQHIPVIQPRAQILPMEMSSLWSCTACMSLLA